MSEGEILWPDMSEGEIVWSDMSEASLTSMGGISVTIRRGVEWNFLKNDLVWNPRGSPTRPFLAVILAWCGFAKCGEDALELTRALHQGIQAIWFC